MDVPKNMIYKRDFYQEVIDNIAKFNCTFIIGPWKCGKTICMLQISDENNLTQYADLKNMTDDDRGKLIDNIVSVEYVELILFSFE